ncbi:MAG TPA: TIGR03943 family protein [Chloroflexota bacterium]|nr:TIGR03943 family protein [Chloroflexota bacterium]
MTVNTLTRAGTRLRVDVWFLLPSIVLAAYGIFILSLAARGDLTLYINPAYVWPSVAAGIGLLVIAGARLLRRPEAHVHDDCDCGDACDCAPAPHRSWPYLVLAIPLLLAILPPRALSSFSALQRGPQLAGAATMPRSTTVRRVSLSVDTATFQLMDWVGALSADPNPRDYLGKPVDVTGMILHAPASVPPGYVMVMRYLVWCCIADARPVGVTVRLPAGASFKDGQWVKVVGTMGETTYQNQKLAVVMPKTMAPTKAGNPYTS